MKKLAAVLLAISAAFSLPLAAGEPKPAAKSAATATAIATFAGGCYWCVESDFDKVKGVVDTTSGFMGGHTENPTYDEVSSGETGHTEVVRVTYDPSIVSYQTLLDAYWRNVDPTDGRGQFCDRGSQYRPAIFVYTGEQKALAEASKTSLEKSHRFADPIAVEIHSASGFTPAKDQDFYKLSPVRYKFYRLGCGRDARLAQLWGGNAGH
ncbi:MAG: peptide-methionine (S)-S-oxide reductase MsrA [Hyphomicrobium sp.]